MKCENRTIRRLSILLIALVVGSIFVGTAFAASNSYAENRYGSYGTWRSTGTVDHNAGYAGATSRSTSTINLISVSSHVDQWVDPRYPIPVWSGSDSKQYASQASVSGSFGAGGLLSFSTLYSTHQYVLNGVDSWTKSYSVTAGYF